MDIDQKVVFTSVMAITDSDIKKLKAVFATKAEMNLRFEQVDKRFEQVDKRFDEVDSKFGMIMNTLDEIMGEVRKNEDERTVIRYRVYDEQGPKLEDHEKRITKLEQGSA